MYKQVNVARVTTMADRSIRVVVDLLNGNDEDIKNVFNLMTKDTVMLLCSSENLIEELQEIVQDLEGNKTFPNNE